MFVCPKAHIHFVRQHKSQVGGSKVCIVVCTNHNGCFYLHILDRQEVEDGLYDSFQNTVDEGLDPVLEHNNVTAASAQCHDDADPEEVVHQAGEGVEDPAQAAQPAHPHVYPAQAADLQTW